VGATCGLACSSGHVGEACTARLDNNPTQMVSAAIADGARDAMPVMVRGSLEELERGLAFYALSWKADGRLRIAHFAGAASGLRSNTGRRP
jgi:hypothetical protein